MLSVLIYTEIIHPAKRSASHVRYPSDWRFFADEVSVRFLLWLTMIVQL
jgi:hypothetical protein